MDRRSFIKVLGAAGVAVLLPTVGFGKSTRNLRSVEIYQQGTWVPGSWESLKKDTIFRLREPDGSIVDQGTHLEVCVAMEDAKACPAPEYHKVNGEPFTVITMEHPLAPRIQVWKDGQRVGLAQRVDMRTRQVLVSQPHDALRASYGRKARWTAFDYVALG